MSIEFYVSAINYIISYKDMTFKKKSNVTKHVDLDKV